MQARMKWVTVAVAGGLLVGGLSGGIALGASETEAEMKHKAATKHEEAMKHEAAMKHEEAMKQQESAEHGAAMSSANLTG